MTDDVWVYLVDGMKVNEAVTENSDGSYSVFINRDLCEAKRLLAYDHALRHISGHDFERSDVQLIESLAH